VHTHDKHGADLEPGRPLTEVDPDDGSCPNFPRYRQLRELIG
jgi:hypothetical protein